MHTCMRKKWWVWESEPACLHACIHAQQLLCATAGACKHARQRRPRATLGAGHFRLPAHTISAAAPRQAPSKQSPRRRPQGARAAKFGQGEIAARQRARRAPGGMQPVLKQVVGVRALLAARAGQALLAVVAENRQVQLRVASRRHLPCVCKRADAPVVAVALTAWDDLRGLFMEGGSRET
jgi:hypothetical protein